MKLQLNAWRYVVALALAIGWVNTSARAAAKADATGTWKWSFTTQNGQTFETTLKLKQDGEKLTGTISGRQGNETEIDKGKVAGDDVSFEVTREFNGNKFTQKYSGKLSGDTIKGKVEMERDGQVRMREWEAKRS